MRSPILCPVCKSENTSAWESSTQDGLIISCHACGKKTYMFDWSIAVRKEKEAAKRREGGIMSFESEQIEDLEKQIAQLKDMVDELKISLAMEKERTVRISNGLQTVVELFQTDTEYIRVLSAILTDGEKI